MRPTGSSLAATAMATWASPVGSRSRTSTTSCAGASTSPRRKAVEWLTKLLAIGPIGAEECLDALGSNEPDFEDGLIRSCAELNDVDFIISRDKDAFAGSTVRCVTAREYLTKVVEQDERRLGFAW